MSDTNKIKNIIDEIDEELKDDSKPEMEMPKSLKTSIEILDILTSGSNDNDKNFKEIKSLVKDIKDGFSVESINLLEKKLGSIIDGLKDIDKKSKDSEIINKLHDVKNAIEEIKIPEEVKVTNQNEEVSIKNFPETQEVYVKNLPKQKEKISIDNLPEIQKVEVINSPEVKDPQNVIVKNEVKVQEPVWYKKPWKMSTFFNKLEELWKTYQRKGLERITTSTYEIEADKHKNPKEALAVKLVDKDGEFIDKLTPNVTVQAPAYGGGSGNGATKIKNSSGDIINPATKENQINGDQKSQLVDTSGRIATVIENSDQVAPLGYMSGLSVVDQDLSALYAGRAFRSEKFVCLDINETKDFLSITYDGPTQIHLIIDVKSTAETEYQVYLEPTVTDNGDLVRQAPRNPHIQFIGGYEPTYTIYENSTITNDGLSIRTEEWGNGSKNGGKNNLLKTILSPNQKLLFRVKSLVNGNCITFLALWEEWQQEDPV